MLIEIFQEWYIGVSMSVKDKVVVITGAYPTFGECNKRLSFAKQALIHHNPPFKDVLWAVDFGHWFTFKLDFKPSKIVLGYIDKERL